MRSVALIGASCGCLVLSAATSAPAATVGVRPDPADDMDEHVHVVAGPGERNRILLRVEVPEEPARDWAVFTWRITDAGSRLTPGAGCVSVDPHTVECTARSSTGEAPVLGRIRLELGDRDDEFGVPAARAGRLSRARVVADGGDGHDHLRGIADSRGRLYGGNGDDLVIAPGSGDHKLDGGPGDDRLQGGSGYDVLRGGGGRDRLYGAGGVDHLIDGDLDGAAGDAGPGPDVLDGGGGSFDRVSYRLRRRPVVVDLGRRGGNGRAGEGDLVSRVESVTGGRGDDRLIGTDRPNTFRGRQGRDLLIGRGAPDEFEPGRGGDVVDCGAGEDRVHDNVTSFDFLGRSCEVVSVYAGGDAWLGLRPYPASVRTGTMTFRVSCPVYDPDDSTEECSGAFRLREAFGKHRLLAAGTFPLGRWYDRPVSVRFTQIGRRLAAQPGGVVAVVSLTGRFNEPFRWRIRLRVRR